MAWLEDKIKCKEIFDLFFPIGYIYITEGISSVDEMNERFTGTEWEKIEGRFLLGEGWSFSAEDGEKYQWSPVGGLGGSPYVTLTVEQMPAHSHQQHRGRSGSNTGYGNSQYEDSNWGGSTSTVGGGKSHENMPPYRIVYMYKRIA